MALDPGWSKTAWAVCVRTGPLTTGVFRPDSVYRPQMVALELTNAALADGHHLDGVLVESLPSVLSTSGSRPLTPESAQGVGELRGHIMAWAAANETPSASVQPGGKRSAGWRSWWIDPRRRAPRGTAQWKLWAYRLVVMLGWGDAVQSHLGEPSDPNDERCDVAEAVLMGVGAIRHGVAFPSPKRELHPTGRVLWRAR